MTDLDPVAEALALLRRKRDALMGEVRHVEEGIAALEKLLGATASPATSHDPNRPSIRTMALSLMEEADRSWSVGEILAEYERRGTPVHGKDPNNALRAAIADAFKAGMIHRTAPGRYVAAKWAEEGPRPHHPTSGPPVGNGSVTSNNNVTTSEEISKQEVEVTY